MRRKYKYITGDGKKFVHYGSALAHANWVYGQYGSVISVEVL